MIQRPDYDPLHKGTFVKVSDIDIRKKADFNKNTNWFDYIREADAEMEAPDPRGYINIPLMAERKKPFESKLKRKRSKTRLMSIALKKEIILPVLDEKGKEVYFVGDNVLTRPYSVTEILSGNVFLKQQAIQYMNSLQEIDYAQSPEFALIIELLSRYVGQTPKIPDLPDLSQLIPSVSTEGVSELPEGFYDTGTETKKKNPFFP